MFTGIITDLGKLIKINQSSLTIVAGQSFLARVKAGDSIAIDGICLTVSGQDRESFGIDYIPETKAKTNIKYLKPGDLVNLELPATYESLLSGHIVQGHVDTTSRLESIKNENNSRILKFSVPKDLSKYIVNKGSIALNGISLTLIEAGKDFFTVGIIPHTWSQTMLHTIKPGDHVNIEVDILAKYIEKLIKKNR